MAWRRRISRCFLSQEPSTQNGILRHPATVFSAWCVHRASQAATASSCRAPCSAAPTSAAPAPRPWSRGAAWPRGAIYIRAVSAGANHEDSGPQNRACTNCAYTRTNTCTQRVRSLTRHCLQNVPRSVLAATFEDVARNASVLGAFKKRFSQARSRTTHPPWRET